MLGGIPSSYFMALSFYPYPLPLCLGCSLHVSTHRPPALDSLCPWCSDGGMRFLQLAAAVGAIAVTGAVCAASMGQGPQGLVAALSKSGFAAAFSLIFVSEIGDKVGGGHFPRSAIRWVGLRLHERS